MASSQVDAMRLLRLQCQSIRFRNALWQHHRNCCYQNRKCESEHDAAELFASWHNSPKLLDGLNCGHVVCSCWRAVRPVDALSVIAAGFGVKPIFASALFFALPFPERTGWLPNHNIEIMWTFCPFFPAPAFGINVPNHMAVAKFDINAIMWWAAALVNRHLHP